MATLADGTKVCLSEVNTSPIVVRGRSPRNFQARKEIPLVGSSASPRGQTTQVSPTAVKRLTQGANNSLVGTTGIMELPKRPYHFGETKFSVPQVPQANGFVYARCLMEKQVANMSVYSYQRWNPPTQHHSEQSTTVPTPPFSQSSMPPYMTSMQAIQPLQSAPPPHPITTQAATFNSPRHYYPPPATTHPQYESNYRPVKSPRLSNAANSSMYQSFETAYATDMMTSNQHHPQPLPNYNYTQDSYQPNIKDEGQNLGGYTWNPAPQ